MSSCRSVYYVGQGLKRHKAVSRSSGGLIKMVCGLVGYNRAGDLLKTRGPVNCKRCLGSGL